MNLVDYLEHLRAKPEHERRMIALATSGGLTLVVFLAWLITFTSSGTLALNSKQPETKDAGATAKTAQSVSNLLGAVGSLRTSLEEGAGVRVVETNTSSTLPAEETTEQTVIPF